MRVKCFLCDKIESIEDFSPLAKKLRNRPIHTYLCDECNMRIESKTKKRIATGNFKQYKSSRKIEKDF
ncbi:YlaI family protein [Jeotgalibacillus sp. JSM ZJ347]|uniref:YlaI family protein n=1 Tax=Jeotgalibacillus sp. JSM ZJ347 TaxID=3342117 RepID=UPI0035A8EA06